MTEVPQIVHRRLRDTALKQAAPVHPDADLMAAFAEQALLPQERTVLLEHLALCGDCRDVLALALPASEAATSLAQATPEAAGVREENARSRAKAIGGFSWANLLWGNMRWAALTAGVACAMFAVYAGVEHRGLEHPGSTNSPIATTKSTAALPIQNSELAKNDSSSKLQVGSSQVGSSQVSEKSEATAQTNSTMSGAATKAPLAQPAVAKKNVISPASTTLASNRPASRKRTTPAPPVSKPASSDSSSSELLAMNQAPSSQSSLNQSLLNQAPSIERAKPPVAEATEEESNEGAVNTPAAGARRSASSDSEQASASPASTLKQETAWSIAGGVLQRSADGGRGWQTVLEGRHAWLSYGVHGPEVWVGGPHGALQHSTDNGKTWLPIEVLAHGQALGSDVIHIDLQDSGRVVLSSADHETWVSGDSGKTWDKQ